MLTNVMPGASLLHAAQSAADRHSAKMIITQSAARNIIVFAVFGAAAELFALAVELDKIEMLFGEFKFCFI
jgi:hypothetical protein